MMIDSFTTPVPFAHGELRSLKDLTKEYYYMLPFASGLRVSMAAQFFEEKTPAGAIHTPAVFRIKHVENAPKGVETALRIEAEWLSFAFRLGATIEDIRAHRYAKLASALLTNDPAHIARTIMAKALAKAEEFCAHDPIQSFDSGAAQPSAYEPAAENVTRFDSRAKVRATPLLAEPADNKIVKLTPQQGTASLSVLPPPAPK